MEWKKCYLDLTLVPLAVLVTLVYHVFLWYKVKKNPLITAIGVNAVGRRLWVQSLIEDDDKKNILAVQTMRNSIMASTLVATISILLTSGLAAVVSSTYSIKKPLNDFIFGAHDELVVAVKYVIPLVFFLFSFFCCSLSIRFLNQVNYLINVPEHRPSLITADYVAEQLERGSIFNTVGTRALYIGFPLLLWTLGPVPVFLCSVALVPMLYNLDFIFICKGDGMKSDERVEEHESGHEYYHIV